MSRRHGPAALQDPSLAAASTSATSEHERCLQRGQSDGRMECQQASRAPPRRRSPRETAVVGSHIRDTCADGRRGALAGLATRPMRDRWIRLGGVLYGISLPVFGVLPFIYADNVASLVPAFYPWPLVWAYITGAGNIVGGAAIALGVVSRLAAILAGGM